MEAVEFLKTLVNFIKTVLRDVVENAQCVYCEVRTEFVCMIFMKLMFRRITWAPPPPPPQCIRAVGFL
jgi:hypothetical protein